MKILLVDIETSPNTAFIWGLWEQNVGPHQLIDTSYTMCWAAKWLGEKEVKFGSIFHNGMDYIQRIHDLMEEADAIVHYNGTKLDIPTLNRESLLHGHNPPSPYKQIDLLKISRKQFKFQSHKLDFVAQELGLAGKTKHKGMDMWKECMDMIPESWEQMKEYNIQDVVLLEQVYERFLPWIKNHANHSVFQGTLCCPNCGSDHFQSRGTAVTSAARYPRYQCQDCGSWFRGAKSEATAPPAERSVSL